MDYSDLREYGITGVFWASLVLFCVVEFWLPLPQAKFDRKRRWPVNLVLAVFIYATALILPVSTLAVALWCEAHGVGLLNLFDAPLALKIIVTVAVNSFVFYLVHYLAHCVPLLWRVHSVHHTDTFVDATTATRTHPFELIVNVAAVSVSILLIGHSPAVLMVYYAAEAFIVIYSHSHVQLPARLERMVSALIVTPRLHHIHHSAFQPETDSNFGNVFIIWDQLLGTFRNETCKGGAVEQFGLEDVSADVAGSLDAQLLRPFTMNRLRPPLPMADGRRDLP